MRLIKTDKKIIAEIKENDDLIIGGFEDTYENLPKKTLLGYQFLNDRKGLSRKIIIRFLSQNVNQGRASEQILLIGSDGKFRDSKFLLIGSD